MPIDMIEKLKTFRTKIESAPAFDRTLGELIGIELFGYIESDEELKKQFYDRFDYLKNLAESQAFIDIQDQLFDAINKILKIVSLEQMEEIKKEWENKFINKLNIEKKDWLTFPELHLALQDKNNYYRLQYRGNSYFSPLEGEISTMTHIVPSKKQYELIEAFFNQLLHYICGKDEILCSKFQNLLKEYNDVWYTFDEKIFVTPTRLHVKDFEDFFYLCTAIYPRKGHEFTFEFNKGSLYSSQSMFSGQLSKIKNQCFTVIDDLIEATDKKKPRKMGLVEGMLYGKPKTKVLHRMIVEGKLNSIDYLKNEIENLKKEKELKDGNTEIDENNQDEEQIPKISKTVTKKYNDIKLEPRDKKGWLQLKKGGKWIDLGGYNTRTYKMVKYVLLPSSKSKKVVDVFEFIKINKDDKNEELQKETTRSYQLKKEIIEECIDTLQKEKYLKGHIQKPVFNDVLKTVVIAFS